MYLVFFWFIPALKGFLYLYLYLYLVLNGYLDFLCLETNARFLLTDSGGVQEESTFFGIPCLTLRENTERPVTVTYGTNTLVGTDPTRIVKESLDILRGNGKKGEVPELWDEGVVQRIVDPSTGISETLYKEEYKTKVEGFLISTLTSLEELKNIFGKKLKTMNACEGKEVKAG